MIKLLSTFFCVGYLPLVPGTFASFIGVFLFYSLKDKPLLYLTSTLGLLLAGFMAAGRAEKMFNAKDCRYIVIDEVGGMFLTLAFLPYYDARVFLVGFMAFRMLDTFKPYPAGPLQHLRGSLGIMSDDIVAGLYANIVLQFALRLAYFSAS